jgi:hypothetical protein
MTEPLARCRNFNVTRPRAFAFLLREAMEISILETRSGLLAGGICGFSNAVVFIELKLD